MVVKPNTFQVFTGVIVAVALAIVIGGGAWMATVIKTLQEEGVARGESIDALSASLDEANRRLTEVGADPVETPAVAPTAGPAGERGQDGEDGGDGEDGADGAPGEKGDTGKPGDAGPAGADGKNATDKQVADAVAAFCGAHSDCVGPAGPTGPTGPTGATGATGETGAPGRDGNDGVGVCPNGALPVPVSIKLSDDTTMNALVCAG